MTPNQKERLARYGQLIFFDGKARVNDVSKHDCLPCAHEQRSFSIFAPTVSDENGNVWSVMYSLMESEKSNDALAWVLQQLRSFGGTSFVATLRTIFSDKGLDENIVSEVFGVHVKCLLCTWHMLTLNLAQRLGKFPSFVDVSVPLTTCLHVSHHIGCLRAMFLITLAHSIVYSCHR